MKYPVAVFDYGIGGIGLVTLIKERYPNLPLLYFSDSGEIPYGKLTRSVLKARVDKLINFLHDEGAHHVVVACHSASSVVVSKERVTGIRELTLNSVKKYNLNSLGIIGGGRTIRAGFYRKNLSDNGILVSQRIAQEFSIMIERGEIDSPELREVASRILTPIKSVDGLLLACTHYPSITKVIRDIMKEDCLIIDPIETVFNSISPLLEQEHTTGKDRFLTSGDPELLKVAAFNAFDFEIKESHHIDL